MYHFFRNNQKFVMIVMVVLMVAFIIPTFFRGQGGYENVKGTIGKDKKATIDQVREAQSELNFLLRSTSPSSSEPPTAASSGFLCRRLCCLFRCSSRWARKREHRALLPPASRGGKMGLSPSIQRVNQELSQPQIGIRMPDGSFTDINRVEQVDEAMAQRRRFSMANLLMVSDAFGRAFDAVKISDPLSKFVVAQQLQQVKEPAGGFPGQGLWICASPTQPPSSFSSNSTVSASTKPTPRRRTRTRSDSATDIPPVGNLQYIGVPREQVRKAVMATKTITRGTSRPTAITSSTKANSPPLPRRRRFAAHDRRQLQRWPSPKVAVDCSDDASVCRGPATVSRCSSRSTGERAPAPDPGSLTSASELVTRSERSRIPRAGGHSPPRAAAPSARLFWTTRGRAPSESFAASSSSAQDIQRSTT